MQPIEQETIARSGIEYRVSIYQDDNAQNPLDDLDGYGIMYSLHRNSGTADKAQEALESNPDAVALSVYSHSGEYWSVKGELPPMMQCQWDSVSIAGAWIPDSVLLDEMKGITGQERRDKLVEFARQAMTLLNQYLAGDVYGFVIESCKHCPTCEHDSYEPVDDCWGYHGIEAVKEAAQESLDSNAPIKLTVKG